MVRGGGSISLLIDSPLQTLARSLRAVGPEVRKQINAHTKSAAQPIWQEETRGRAMTLLKQRVLVSTARVGVGKTIILRSATVGSTSKGTPASVLAWATEFGGGAGKIINSRTKGGTAYRRRLGATFGPQYRNGTVVYPAARDSIPRFASLAVATARRTIHEQIEKGNA